MQDNGQNLKKILEELRQETVNDRDATKLINQGLSKLTQGVNFDKVVFELNRELNNYSLVHGFKLPQALIRLKIMLNENPDKWKFAGLTGSI